MKMMKRIFAQLFLPVFLLMGALSPLFADMSNYQNYIVGDRAAGMGGAVVAGSKDIDSAYYNPAGLARVDGSRISLSVSLYGIYRVSVLDALGTGKSYRARAFESIPSAFGSVLKLSDNFAVAFSVFTPDQTDYNEQKTFEMYPTRTPGLFQSDYFSYTIDDDQMWLGPSFGIGLSDRLSLGAGIYGVYESSLLKQSWNYLFTKGDEVVRVSSRVYNIDYYNYSLLALVGLNYRLTDEIIAGIRVQTPTVNLGGSGEFLYGVSLGDPDLDELVHADHMNTANSLPAAFSFGVAYKKPNNFTLEADLTYHLPTSYNALKGADHWSGEQVELQVRREPVVNLNLGGEYYVHENYPVRAGFFTNFASSPDPSVDNITNLNQVDMYGITASIGNESEHTTLNLGFNYTWGSGKTTGVGDDFETVVVDINESHIFVFMSSAYIF